MRIFVTSLILLLLLLPLAFAQSIKTVGPQKAKDASYDYFIQVLKKTLAITEKEYGETQLDTVPHPGQERVMVLLSMGKFYDVVWSGSSKKRDEHLLKIPFPLFKGGLGWRGSVIRKDDIKKFSQITKSEELAKLIACQGMHWPDADILEQGGLKVYRVTHFDSMLQMLVLKRCDYLPLSIFEGDRELAIVAKSFPSLIFSHDLIISYPLTMNFYVHSSNNVLAERLQLGLERLHHSGQFLQFMQSHPLTQNAFPLSHFSNANIINLDNRDHTGDALERYGLKWPKANQK